MSRNRSLFRKRKMSNQRIERYKKYLTGWSLSEWHREVVDNDKYNVYVLTTPTRCVKRRIVVGSKPGERPINHPSAGNVAESVSCCCGKRWMDGNDFESFGGDACFMCSEGRCDQTKWEA